MIALKNIHPLSEFLRNAKSFITRLKRSADPVVLTVNGQAEAVILSAEAFEALVQRLETAEIQNLAGQSALEMLRTGAVKPEELIAELKPAPHAAGVPADKAFEELRRRAAANRKKKAS